MHHQDSQNRLEIINFTFCRWSEIQTPDHGRWYTIFRHCAAFFEHPTFQKRNKAAAPDRFHEGE